MAKSLMLLTILGTGLCDAYKILVVFPLPGRSHSLLGEGVVKQLLRAGHEVTYITPFLMDNNIPELHQVDVTDNLKLFPEKLTVDGIMKKQIRIQEHSFVMQISSKTNINALENPNVQRMMNDTNQTFDAVIVEWLFSELLAGLSAVYDTPLIWLSSVEPHWMILDLIDHIVNPAYNSDSLSVNTPPLNFKQRVEELWTIIKVKYFKWSYANAFESEQYERIFGPEILKRRNKVPSFNDVKYSGSLVLGNSHFSMGQAIRLPQNYKHVGGFHIEENMKPLPEDLQKIMDGAKNGVIYFSMGSILNSKDLPEEIKNNLLEMFGKLKQTVLWKFEEALPNKPENVHILKWAPQASILAHSNCVLFITHSGLLSTTETVHYGVPIIGVPIFADQFINVARSVPRGYALRVDVSPTMADDLKNAIEEIIGNPKYTQMAKQLSVLYHDRHMTPGDELIYWVEYVIRTNGAPHLRSPALSIPWYQKAYVDAATVLLSFIIIVYILIKKIICCIYSKKQEKSVKKNN